jgi:hypothetical protein
LYETGGVDGMARGSIESEKLGLPPDILIASFS